MFIKKFMEFVVFLNISNEVDWVCVQDELLQSVVGKMIMIIEFKFVLNQVMFVYVLDGFDVNIRLVDCVGYIVFGVKGYEDENGLWMINMFWYEELILFYEVVEIGI